MGVIAPPSNAKRGEPCPIGGPHERIVFSRGGCQMHYMRAYKHGSADWVPARKPPEPAMPKGRNYIETDCTYDAAHSRVVRRRGKAGTHACRLCGGRARDWAYMGGSLRELWGVPKNSKHTGIRRALAYSPIAMDYIAPCRMCHVRMDRFALRFIGNCGKGRANNNGKSGKRE